MNHFVTTLFVLVGLVNLLPVAGVISDQRLSRMYRLDALTPDVALLLRHRAVLFGIVGALLIHAAFQPALRGLATAAGLASMVSFCCLVLFLGNSNPSLIRIAWIDVGAIAALLLAFGLHRFTLGNTP